MYALWSAVLLTAELKLLCQRSVIIADAILGDSALDAKNTFVFFMPFGVDIVICAFLKIGGLSIQPSDTKEVF